MRPATTSHVFHFILTVITGGLWLPVWILCACLTARSNTKKQFAMQQELIEKLGAKNA